MKPSSKIIQLSSELKRITSINERTYLLYGSEEAVALYEVSMNTLIVSDKYDFDVACVKQGNSEVDFLDDIVPLERFLIIDENTFRMLHQNLCQKLKKFMIDPMVEKHKKKIKKKSLK